MAMRIRAQRLASGGGSGARRDGYRRLSATALSANAGVVTRGHLLKPITHSLPFSFGQSLSGSSMRGLGLKKKKYSSLQRNLPKLAR